MLRGTLGASDKTVLKNQSSANLFERGQADEFEVSASCEPMHQLCLRASDTSPCLSCEPVYCMNDVEFFNPKKGDRLAKPGKQVC